MIKLKGRTNVNLETGEDIYIYQKDYRKVIFQENSSGEEELDLTEIFESARTWKWGIRNSRYAGVFLNAISFKSPNLVLNVPNVLISVRLDKDFAYINAFVFAKSEELAFRYANQFKNENREHIAFELSRELRKYPLKISREESLYELIYGIQRRLEKIEKNTEEVKETTSRVKVDLEEIKSVIYSVKEDLKKEIENIKVEIKALKESSVKVHFIKDDGIYKDGEKIYLNFLGELFDYLEPDYESLEKKGIYVKDRKLFNEFIKEKFLKKETEVSKEEFQKLGINSSRNWVIQFKVNDYRLRKLLTALSSNSLVPFTELERAFKKLISDVVEGKAEISLEILKKYIRKEHLARFNAFLSKAERMLLGSVRKEIKGDLYVKSDIPDLVLYAIMLEAEKENLKVQIDQR